MYERIYSAPLFLDRRHMTLFNDLTKQLFFLHIRPPPFMNLAPTHGFLCKPLMKTTPVYFELFWKAFKALAPPPLISGPANLFCYYYFAVFFCRERRILLQHHTFLLPLNPSAVVVVQLWKKKYGYIRVWKGKEIHLRYIGKQFRGPDYVFSYVMNGKREIKKLVNYAAFK